jgi:hypothetical protein
MSFATLNDDDIDSFFQEDAPAVELHGHLEYNNSADSYQNEAIPIYLEDKTIIKSITFTKPEKIESRSLIPSYKAPTFQPIKNNLETASKFTAQEYDIKPISTSYSEKIGNFTFGTKYDSFLYSAQLNYSTGIFGQYEGKRFALSSAFLKNTNSNYTSYNDSFYIAPEIKLTKRLSFIDLIKSDVNQISKSNMFLLRYTPHLKKHDDNIQLELGAGQYYYQDNYIKSSVNFATRFKL